MKNQVRCILGALMSAQVAFAAAPVLNDGVYHPYTATGKVKTLGHQCIERVVSIAANTYRVETLMLQELYKDEEAPFFPGYPSEPDCSNIPLDLVCKGSICTASVVSAWSKGGTRTETLVLTLLNNNNFVLHKEFIYRNKKNVIVDTGKSRPTVYLQADANLKKQYEANILVLQSAVTLAEVLTDETKKKCRWDFKKSAILANLGVPVINISNDKQYYEFECLKSTLVPAYNAFLQALDNGGFKYFDTKNETYGTYTYKYSYEYRYRVFLTEKQITFEDLSIYLTSVEALREFQANVISETKEVITKLSRIRDIL